MSDWQPTNELRFVERTEFDTQFDQTGMAFSVDYKVKILQQKYINNTKTYTDADGYVYPSEEWRDVPVESE